MDPPWIDDIISGINVTTDLCSSSEQENKIPIEQASTRSSIVLAPIARFGTTKESINLL